MKRIISVLLLVVLIGMIGFRFITEDDWIECLFVAIITLTTVGYEEPKGLESAGKIFIIIYLFCGLGIFTYSITHMVQWFASGEAKKMRARKRMNQTIDNLSKHYIICGLGRMGQVIGEYLEEHQQPFVIIDNDEQRVEHVCKRREWLYIIGDVTRDETLIKAGVERAKSLATVLPTDANNLFVVLSARMLSSELQIVSRASASRVIDKLKQAGATRVVSPYSTGATKMARFLMTPNVEDFLEVAGSRGQGLELADVQIDENSSYIGKKLMETDFKEKGIVVIGIQRATGERLFPPAADSVIKFGDSLFTFGAIDAVNTTIATEEPS